MFGFARRVGGARGGGYHLFQVMCHLWLAMLGYGWLCLGMFGYGFWLCLAVFVCLLPGEWAAKTCGDDGGVAGGESHE